jgi:hypothetical protein
MKQRRRTSNGRRQVLGLLSLGWVVCATCVMTYSFARSESARVNIVGLGATTCAEFAAHVAKDPAAQTDYFAWAQGFMSGILIAMPAGIDENLDLKPPTYPLVKQIEYLLNYCRQRASEDYSDAVLDLYRTLRKESKK